MGMTPDFSSIAKPRIAAAACAAAIPARGRRENFSFHLLLSTRRLL
jgi:hypothetical protein